jgi:hypothetical protein
MPTAEELRAKAARAFRLAEQVADEGAAANLQKFALELLEQAQELERTPPPPPAESAPQVAQQQQQPQPPEKEE